jgi:hypothetical protein
MTFLHILPLEIWSSYGACTLLGSLHEAGFSPEKHKHLTLSFQSTSMSWKEMNGGPHLTLMAEHVPQLFLADCLTLISQGVQITLDTHIEDPRDEP